MDRSVQGASRGWARRAGAIIAAVLLVEVASGAPWLGIALGLAFDVLGALVLARRIDPSPLANALRIPAERSTAMFAGLALLALGLVTTGIGVVALQARAAESDRLVALAAKKTAHDEAQRQAARRREEDLRRRIPEIVAGVAEHLERAGTLRQQRQYEEALTVVQKAADILKTTDALAPAPAEVRAAWEALRPAIASLEPIVAARYAVDTAPGSIADADLDARDGNYLRAESTLTTLESALAVDPAVLPYLDDDPTPLLKRARSRRKQIAPLAQRQREREANAQAQADAKRAQLQAAKKRCGAEPMSAGVVPAVEIYLKAQAHDPESIDVVQCSPLGFDERDCWRSVCQYRGKNAFGALILQTAGFYMTADDQGLPLGRVTKAERYE